MHRIGGKKKFKKKKKKLKKKTHSNFIFFSEIRNLNVGGPVNQLIKKKAL
jgi:hypothetical protein